MATKMKVITLYLNNVNLILIAFFLLNVKEDQLQIYKKYVQLLTRINLKIHYGQNKSPYALCVSHNHVQYNEGKKKFFFFKINKSL